MIVYIEMPNFTLELRFQGADWWILSEKYSYITEINRALIWKQSESGKNLLSAIKAWASPL